MQHEGSAIPRIVIIIGDNGFYETAVISDAPVEYVLVSTQQQEVETCASFAAEGHLDDPLQMGVDLDDGKPVVINGPYVRRPDEYSWQVEKYYEQSPWYSSPVDPGQSQVPSQAVSEAISEPISEAISEAKSGQESRLEIEVRMTQIDEALARLDAGEQMDASRSNGLLHSSKDIVANGDGTYTVNHDIDGSQTYFSRDAIVAVLAGERDIWDGDLGGWNADERREYDADGNWTSEPEDEED